MALPVFTVSLFSSGQINQYSKIEYILVWNVLSPFKWFQVLVLTAPPFHYIHSLISRNNHSVPGYDRQSIEKPLTSFFQTP
jgi:hypothetical protein